MSAFDTLSGEDERPKIRRLNKLPIFVFVGLVVVLVAVVIWGLAERGFYRNGSATELSSGRPASDFADDLKRSGPDGMIESPRSATPPPPVAPSIQRNPESAAARPAPAEDWRARLRREQEEEILRLQHQQFLAGVQAHAAAIQSPMAISVQGVEQGPDGAGGGQEQVGGAGLADLLASAMGGGSSAAAGSGIGDPNGQAGKIGFFNDEISELGYLHNAVAPQFSPHELKRGSVIPATLITGINSDLPGRISAQISQNVYDSATGRLLLIPQGAKLFGRYDSNVSFGQSRVLVVWTDLIFPNGSTLQIGGMAGVDAQGYGGFNDQVDNHYLQTFGAAAMIALVGGGIQMLEPPKSEIQSFVSAVRGNASESFGTVAKETVSRHLSVQPTLQIRPGYVFNVMVEKDIVFPGVYR